MSDHRLVSAELCARILGVTKGTLYRMARENIIPCFRVGPQRKGVRFDVEEVRDALRQEDEEED